LELRTIEANLSFKAIGHQWYWSYEYSDYLNHGFIMGFDSNMVYEDELNTGDFRLLQVYHPVILPTGLHIRVIVTSIDVLHSWAVPSLGIKLDGIPGRLNQGFIYLKREGVFYGQCSELCGVDHGFMPVVVKAVDYNEYVKHFLCQDGQLCYNQAQELRKFKEWVSLFDKYSGIKR
jgi:cytochrome c oxidase subunit 2